MQCDSTGGQGFDLISSLSSWPSAQCQVYQDDVRGLAYHLLHKTRLSTLKISSQYPRYTSAAVRAYLRIFVWPFDLAAHRSRCGNQLGSLALGCIAHGELTLDSNLFGNNNQGTPHEATNWLLHGSRAQSNAIGGMLSAKGFSLQQYLSTHRGPLFPMILGLVYMRGGF